MTVTSKQKLKFISIMTPNSKQQYTLSVTFSCYKHSLNIQKNPVNLVLQSEAADAV